MRTTKTWWLVLVATALALSCGNPVHKSARGERESDVAQGHGPDAHQAAETVHHQDLAADRAADISDACVPDCEGKQCGDDGCGGSCGGCEEFPKSYCANAKCLCTITCFGKECGDNGCGGSCGECTPSVECVEGLCMECDDGNDEEWDGCTDGKISEFAVNDLKNVGHQRHPVAAAFPSGGFVVGWQAFATPSATSMKLLGQAFGADGSCIGGNFEIAEGASKPPDGPAMAVLSDDGFIAAWAQGSEVNVRRFGSDGSPASDVVSIDSGEEFRSAPAVTTMNDGVVAVVWEEKVDSPSWDGQSEVRGQLYYADMTEKDEQFLISGPEAACHELASVASFSAGGLAVVWHRSESCAKQPDILGQTFDSIGGTLSAPFQVNTFEEGKQAQPGLAVLDGGSFVVVWRSWGQDGYGFGVFGQLRAADGSQIGGEFQMNTHPEGNQGFDDKYSGFHVQGGRQPVAAVPGGGFVVVWESCPIPAYELDKGYDGDGCGIFGQYLDSGGVNVGWEFQVNSMTYRNQVRPSVAAFADGTYVVVWESDHCHGGGSQLEKCIYAQRFGADGARLYR